MHAGAHRDVIGAALRAVQRALAPLRTALAEDPLRLALPPVPAGGAEALGREVLAAYAALYLYAELEEAGVLPAVEALAEQRHELALQDRSTAQRLERFGQDARRNLTRTDRARIFSRLFGMGAAALASVQGTGLGDPRAWGLDDSTRLDFRQRLLRLATAAVRADQERATRGGQPGLSSQAAWRAAARDMLALVGAQPAGSLVQWARSIHARALRAFEVLGDAGLQRQLLSRTPWQTLQRLLPEEGAAARDEAARRGAAGQALLQSLATAEGDAGPRAESVQAAQRWLVASGLAGPEVATLAPGRAPGLPNSAFTTAVPAVASPADLVADDALPEDTWAEAAA